MRLFGSLKEGIKDLFFPPFCLSCQLKLNDEEKNLCAPCLSLIEFLNPQDLCPYCASETTLFGVSPHDCKVRSSSLMKIASVFGRQGPPLKIAASYRKGNHFLAKTMAAYMAAYWLGRDNPLPNLVVPLSLPWHEKRRLGFNPNALLAEELALFFEGESRAVLKHKLIKDAEGSGSHSFSYKPQVAASCLSKSMAWRGDQNATDSLQDRDILLIALSREDLPALIDAADSLQDENPQSVSALTFI